MSIAIPNTIGASDKLLAALLMENSDEIKRALEKLEVPDVNAADGWVRSEHIMRGEYNGIKNEHVFVSAIMGGKTYSLSARDFTYATEGNTLVLGSNPVAYVPKTSASFEMATSGTLLFQYWMCPITMDNLDADVGASYYSEFAIYLGNSGLPAAATRVRSIEEDHHVTANYPWPLKRYFLGGAALVEDLGPGTYNVGLVSKSNTAKTVIVAWGFSYEFLHI